MAFNVKTLGLNVSIYISSLAQKAKSIQIHPPYTRLPSPGYGDENEYGNDNRNEFED